MQVKIVAVSYLNTKPFIAGIQKSEILKDGFELELAHPSDCAQTLIEEKADIGLIPVAMLPRLENYEVISEYCIGAKGKVETVCLYSEVPLNEITEIYLDYQSRTSVRLIKILAQDLWNIKPIWVPAEEGFEENIQGAKAALIIGDRAFKHNLAHSYSFDLAEEWYKLTNKPFVFACWVAKKSLDRSKITQFNEALRLGIESVNDFIPSIAQQFKGIEVENYLTQRIKFRLDEEMNSGLERFLQYLSTPSVNH